MTAVTAEARAELMALDFTERPPMGRPRPAYWEPAQLRSEADALHRLLSPRQLAHVAGPAAMPHFGVQVVLERCRLAQMDPGGEADAVAPLDPTRARYIALEIADEFEEGRRHRPVTRPRMFSGRRDPRELLDRILAASGTLATGERGVTRCPGHEDRRRSLSWRIIDDRLLLHCFAGCTFDEIRGAVA